MSDYELIWAVVEILAVLFIGYLAMIFAASYTINHQKNKTKNELSYPEKPSSLNILQQMFRPGTSNTQYYFE